VTRELGFPVKDARKEPVRYLWFVGDFASFDERLQVLSRRLAHILRDAGVDFGMLFDGERDDGNDVRRIGEEGLFQLLAEQNMESFRSASFDEIFTTDPHSFNTLPNEYPAFGLDKPVIHYSQLLQRLLGDGSIPVEPLGLRVTYHDPCYLARHNRLTGPPRQVLGALGCDLVEMPRNGLNTFCCGAGGGRIWMTGGPQDGERPSENRIREAVGLDGAGAAHRPGRRTPPPDRRPGRIRTVPGAYRRAEHPVLPMRRMTGTYQGDCHGEHRYHRRRHHHYRRQPGQANGDHLLEQ